MLTEEEAAHLVAREVAKQRMGDMERKISENENKVTISLAELKQQINQVMLMIEKQNVEQGKSSKELKEEIEKEFASKLDLQRVENKLDGLLMKITVVVATVSTIGAAISWFLNVSKAVH